MPIASNVIVALLACGDSKLGVGSNAFEPPGLAAPDPRPREANVFQSTAWFAPPKRIRSAASIASRASTMLTAPLAISSHASNMSCTQRRLPGQAVTGVSPSAHDLLEREVRPTGTRRRTPR